MKTVVLPPPRGHKYCPDCHGWGAIYQELTGDRQIAHPCAECEEFGYVPISRKYFEPSARPSKVLHDFLARSEFFVTTVYRYCELCGDFAEHTDRRSNGLIVHADRVCSLYQLRTVAGDAAVGDVVATVRLMNYHAPVQVAGPPEPPLNGCPNWISRTLRVGRWTASGVRGQLRVVFDGPEISRDMPAVDLMPRADPSITRPDGFPPSVIPTEWVNPPVPVLR